MAKLESPPVEGPVDDGCALVGWAAAEGSELAAGAVADEGASAAALGASEAVADAAGVEDEAAAGASVFGAFGCGRDMK